MAGIDGDAISGLFNALDSLMPPVPDPALRPVVSLGPASIKATGVGGFVGINQEPRGDVFGRRLDATALVTVRAANAGELSAAVTSVTQALMGAERTSLRERGILRITLDQVGPDASGPGDRAHRDLTFRIIYEFLKRPQEASGVIQEVPLNLRLSQTRAPQTLLKSPFVAGSLNWFEAVDDPGATRSRPGRWQYNASEGRIEQRSNVWGGSSGPDPNKPGAYLLLRTREGLPPVQDFVLKVNLRSEDDDGIGLVFRWQGVDNFYFFLMHSGGNYRLVGKKVAGQFANLSTPALDAGHGYQVGANHEVEVTARGPSFHVRIDGVPALAGRDESLPAAGRVGLLSHGNNRAFFRAIELVQL